MALILSAPITEARPKRVMRSIRTRKRDEEYLYNLIKDSVTPAVNQIQEQAESGSEIIEQGAGAFEAGLEDTLKATITKWAEELNARNKQETEKVLARALGVDTAYIMDDATVGKVIPSFADVAVALIKGDLDDFKSDIKNAVLKNIQGIPFEDGRSLTQEIKHLAGVTMERARLIARDQTHKINTGITQQRQQALGIEEYIWRTSQDQRVVGNPAGLYPRGNHVHGNHYERDGKKFRWDDPPFDGHPGYAINCRCTADPVIDLEKIDLSSGTVTPPKPLTKTFKGVDGTEFKEREEVEATSFGKRLLREKLSSSNPSAGWEIRSIEILGETEKAWRLGVEVYSRYMHDNEAYKIMFLPKKGGIQKMRTDEQKAEDYAKWQAKKDHERQKRLEKNKQWRLAEAETEKYKKLLEVADEIGLKTRKGTSLKTLQKNIAHKNWELRLKDGKV